MLAKLFEGLVMLLGGEKWRWSKCLVLQYRQNIGGFGIFAAQNQRFAPHIQQKK